MQVTVVPSDKLIIVDGESILFNFEAPSNMHALQWYGDAGHIEWTDGKNQELSATDYNTHVLPYVQLWEKEKARLEQNATEAEAARLAEYNSETARFNRLRAERDNRLSVTDYLVMPDYSLDEATHEAVVTYRQALRDLPAQEGAPWDGGGKLTPWPEEPAFMKKD